MRSTRHHAALACAVIATTLSPLVSPMAPTVSGQSASKRPDQSTRAPPVDGGWPRASTTASGASLVIYQPQIASWVDQKDIVFYAAVSYTPAGASSRPSAPSRPSRPRAYRRRNGSSASRISGSPTRTSPRSRGIRPERWWRRSQRPSGRKIELLALDRVLANLDKSQIVPKNIEGVKAEPPPIFFSKTPGILVNVDGDPIWSAIKDNDLQFAVNTNWDLFRHTPTKPYICARRIRGSRRRRCRAPGHTRGCSPTAFTSCRTTRTGKP